MKSTSKRLRNQNTADISRKIERSERPTGIGRWSEVVAPSATSEPLSEVHSRFISLYPSRDFTGLCIILRAGVPVGIVWSPTEPLYPPWPPSRCIYYPGISRHRENEEGEGEELFLSLSLSPFISRSSSSFTRTWLVQAKENKTEERGKCVLDRRAERCRGPH